MMPINNAQPFQTRGIRLIQAHVPRLVPLHAASIFQVNAPPVVSQNSEFATSRSSINRRTIRIKKRQINMELLHALGRNGIKTTAKKAEPPKEEAPEPAAKVEEKPSEAEIKDKPEPMNESEGDKENKASSQRAMKESLMHSTQISSVKGDPRKSARSISKPATSSWLRTCID
uniref:Uncharacterized protein n=1 Tax=Acrobeloides nanus TaxID=290746 RepID=A0A914CDH8_9BILA